MKLKEQYTAKAAVGESSPQRLSHAKSITKRMAWRLSPGNIAATTCQRTASPFLTTGSWTICITLILPRKRRGTCWLRLGSLRFSCLIGSSIKGEEKSLVATILWLRVSRRRKEGMICLVGKLKFRWQRGRNWLIGLMNWNNWWVRNLLEFGLFYLNY